MRRVVPVVWVLLVVLEARADCALVYDVEAPWGPTAPLEGIVAGPRQVMEAPVRGPLALVRENVRIPLRRELIGRGPLARWVPERPPAPGSWTIDGLVPPNRIELRAEALPALSPPRARLVYTRGPLTRRGENVSVTAHLAEPVPDGAIAIVAEWAGTGEHVASGAAGALEAGARESVLFQSPGHCGSGPSPEYWPYRGASARVGFVDRAGNVVWAANRVSIR